MNQVQNIAGRHCSACGNTDENDLTDNYSDCCNENVVEYTTEFLGEVTPALYYPNGTNEPGVEETCANQGDCFHD